MKKTPNLETVDLRSNFFIEDEDQGTYFWFQNDRLKILLRNEILYECVKLLHIQIA